MIALPERIIRFVLVGVINTAFGYFAYSALVFLSSPLWLAVSGSLVAGVIFNFVTYGAHVFQMRSPFHFVLFVGFYGALAAINAILLNKLVGFGFSPYSAQLVLVVPMASLAFIGLNYGVFGSWTRNVSMQQRSHNRDA